MAPLVISNVENQRSQRRATSVSRAEVKIEVRKSSLGERINSTENKCKAFGRQHALQMAIDEEGEHQSGGAEAGMTP